MTGADLTEAKVEEIAERTADIALEKMLLRLGIDVNDPQAFTNFRKTMNHSQAWMQSTETVKNNGLAAAAWTVGAALIGYAIFLLSGGKFSP